MVPRRPAEDAVLRENAGAPGRQGRRSGSGVSTLREDRGADIYASFARDLLQADSSLNHTLLYAHSRDLSARPSAGELVETLRDHFALATSLSISSAVANKLQERVAATIPADISKFFPQVVFS